MGFHNLMPQNGEAPPCPRLRKFSQILGTEPHECSERPQASFPTSYENSESSASGMESQPSRDQSGLSVAGQSLVTFPAPQPPLLPQLICIPELTIPKILHLAHTKHPSSLSPHSYPAKSLLLHVPHKYCFFCYAFLEASCSD